MPQLKIVAKNFMDMVASLPTIKLDRLYEKSFICEAIFRSLPPLAKKYAILLLYIDASVSAKLLEEWVLADGVSKHKVAIDRLIQLRVPTDTLDRKEEATYRFNPRFQLNLQKHLVHGGVLPREPMLSNISVRLPSLEDLDAYALRQRESHFPVYICSRDLVFLATLTLPGKISIVKLRESSCHSTRFVRRASLIILLP